MIEGVKLIPITTHSDDRGHLSEIYRTDTEYHQIFGGQINQVYIVEDPVRGTVRAFHRHQKLWDFFYISHGSAKFALHDGREKSSTFKETNTFVLGDKQRKMLVVPPGVYHGWMSLEDDTQLLSIASHTYNPGKPDEERVPYDSFGYDWTIQFK
jgi:dTDP-4-dehydrorhamnose 3,5-epimerase